MTTILTITAKLLTALTFLCHTPALGRGNTNDNTDNVQEGVGVGAGVGGVIQEEEGGPQITWGRPNTNNAYFHHHTPTNVTAVVGQRAVLTCKVLNLDNKDVSWIRQRDLHILTIGMFTYTSDDRFTVRHPEESEEWYLEISPVTFRDAGVYECQVSASPKIFLPVLLTVQVQQAQIQGPREVFIQSGSTIKLTCLVNTHSDNVGAVVWFRDSSELDYDSPRGGVSIEIEKTPTRTTSKLFLTRAAKADSGNYTCAPKFADAASVTVHVVNGEESAAVHTASSAGTLILLLHLLLLFLLFLYIYFKLTVTSLPLRVWSGGGGRLPEQ
ncbi:hypothetical protein Pmani_024902 [Petrolisthes manimaculis]|uniref:Ig-like domain-containing protein n=1 Tax=Petrolisthes manimaculis TaxID=1843537 RepID=A0AAE1P9D4_9EUCA|nr:hypothetical protein Pmani_024902 [Petrolisthes manimaculis]